MGVRIATFNVHHCAPPSGWARLATVARVVSAMRPDVMAVQELDRGMRRSLWRDQARRLADANGHQLVFSQTLQRDAGAYGIALVSRWPITDVEVLSLPRDRGRERRVAQLALIHPPGEERFLMVGTHLQNERAFGGAAPHAMSQLAVLLERVHERAGTDGVSMVVVAGDLNTDRAGTAFEAAGYSWAPSSPTFPALRPRRHIDWIAVRGGSPRLWEVPTTRVSDHRPLVVEVVADTVPEVANRGEPGVWNEARPPL